MSRIILGRNIKSQVLDIKMRAQKFKSIFENSWVFQRDMTVVTARFVDHHSNKILPFYINNAVGDKRGTGGADKREINCIVFHLQ